MSLENSKILITGGTGFVGKNLILALEKENINFYNLTEEDNLDSVFKENSFSRVVHLAGQIQGSKKELYTNNYILTKNLISACEKYNIKKFIHFSSYLADEKFKGNYAKTKLLAEKEILKSNLEYVILKPTLIYGSHGKDGIDGLKTILNKLPIVPLPISKNIQIQPIYIDDVIIYVLNILKQDKFNKQTYYLAGKKPVIFSDFIKLIAKSVNKKIFLPLPAGLVKITADVLKINRLCNILQNNSINIEKTISDLKHIPTEFESIYE
jgi:nucleoside-diphosphate-sugar epimerase